ncbi:MAG: rubredoxin [Cyclobacteriaceae bacterium]|jgi:rubredoxin|nr:rubredoxin [Cyclobacteriaceae bacterium]
METRKRDLIRAFVMGGILSPADLLRIIDLSRKLGNRYVMFGSRQDIMFPSNGADPNFLTSAFRAIGIDFEVGSDQSEYQNIVSSYAAVHITETTPWVKEDTYHFVIDNFDFRPKLKINIVDPAQSIVPLFTGELNFIASREENYWYLYVRNGNRVECWPTTIFTQDIAKLARILEELVLTFTTASVDELFTLVQARERITSRPIREVLAYPDNIMPYYEGLNAMLNNLYSLGLYWRNNRYDVDFMSAACRLCQDTNIPKINIIPWKAFVIKGIKSADRIRWEKLMGKFGINERHSSLELNWHLPVIDNEALELKRFLVRELDQQDISTHGLTFTIKTKRDMIFFTSIVIEKDITIENAERYNILYARDFNPNNIAYQVYAQNVRKEVIPALLIELSKLYFRQLNPEREPVSPRSKTTAPYAISTSYQCTNCLTIYDKNYGDPFANIPPGVPFEDLPDTYTCHVCDSPKREFRAVGGREDRVGEGNR